MQAVYKINNLKLVQSFSGWLLQAGLEKEAREVPASQGLAVDWNGPGLG